MAELTIDPRKMREMASVGPSLSVTELSRIADQAIDAHEVEGRIWAEYCGRELDLEADRAAAQLEAVRRIMGTENDLTHQPHSATSALKVVELDERYRAYLAKQSETVVLKNDAYTKMRSAYLRAEKAVAAFKIAGGLR